MHYMYGLTFRSEDVDKLSKLIMYVIDHPDKAISIGAAWDFSSYDAQFFQIYRTQVYSQQK